ncbi:Putative zinc-finger [Nonomuraea solani]|uniref:Putative zinc-finger n=1 Tax=Nonomuraea solani TaxID=1144553 RepID=A0A1H6EUB7_9ACTN|nr:zf-HC2 domain-containing protein [Nonomuraea solani]SEH00429.1 Putative zinc-finger [Nonomuraea solani]
MMTCEEVRLALGAHALGALDPDEALEIDTHLATCEACGGELLELEGVASFLGKVSERDVELVASPPRQVLDRLLNDRVKRTRRGRVLMAVAASAAVLVVGGTVYSAIQLNSQQAAPSSALAPVTTSSEESAPKVMRDQGAAESDSSLRSAEPSQSPAEKRPTPVRKQGEGRKFTGENKLLQYNATVVAWSMDGGTQLDVQVSGVPVDTTCSLVVVAKDGRREATAGWVVSREEYQGQGQAVFPRQTTMVMREIARFEIVDGAGKVLVRVPARK